MLPPKLDDVIQSCLPSTIRVLLTGQTLLEGFKRGPLYLRWSLEMGKTSRRQEQGRLEAVLRLQQECVRRNSDYRKAYKALKNIADPEERAIESYLLSVKWGLSRPDALPNPEELDLEQLKAGRELRQELSFSANVTFGDPVEGAADMLWTDQPRGFLFLQYFPEEDPSSYRHAVVDLRRPKKEIQRAVLNLIDTALLERQRHGLKQIHSMKRIHLETCFKYIKAYDLWKAGKKIREIAHEILQGDVGDIEGKAKRYLKNGKTLVNDPPITRLFRIQLAARRKGRGLESISVIHEDPLSLWGKAGWLRPASLVAKRPSDLDSPPN